MRGVVLPLPGAVLPCSEQLLAAYLILLLSAVDLQQPTAAYVRCGAASA
jgi:hypothetical protein